LQPEFIPTGEWQSGVKSSPGQESRSESCQLPWWKTGRELQWRHCLEIQ